MKVTLEAKIQGGVTLEASAEVVTFGDLKKLGTALQNKMAKVRSGMPEMLALKLERLRIVGGKDGQATE